MWSDAGIRTRRLIKVTPPVVPRSSSVTSSVTRMAAKQGTIEQNAGLPGAERDEPVCTEWLRLSGEMAVGGGIEPPTIQNAEITKPASVRHSLAVLGSQQRPVWQKCGKGEGELRDRLGLPLEARIPHAPVHLAHSADRRDDLVGAEPCAGGEI